MAHENTDSTEHLWRLFRAAQIDHMDGEEPPEHDTLDAFRKRAEKAGLIAVANHLTQPRK
jgi:hypothetical protein